MSFGRRNSNENGFGQDSQTQSIVPPVNGAQTQTAHCVNAVNPFPFSSPTSSPYQFPIQNPPGPNPASLNPDDPLINPCSSPSTQIRNLVNETREYWKRPPTLPPAAPISAPLVPPPDSNTSSSMLHIVLGNKPGVLEKIAGSNGGSVGDVSGGGGSPGWMSSLLSKKRSRKR